MSEKFTPPMISPSGGMMTSPTSDETIFPKAAPMMTPTARSTTLPFMANSLNSDAMLMAGSAWWAGTNGTQALRIRASEKRWSLQRAEHLFEQRASLTQRVGANRAFFLGHHQVETVEGLLCYVGLHRCVLWFQHPQSDALLGDCIISFREFHFADG